MDCVLWMELIELSSISVIKETYESHTKQAYA